MRYRFKGHLLVSISLQSQADNKTILSQQKNNQHITNTQLVSQ